MTKSPLVSCQISSKFIIDGFTHNIRYNTLAINNVKKIDFSFFPTLSTDYMYF